jgi:hypothetical protein
MKYCATQAHKIICMLSVQIQEHVNLLKIVHKIERICIQGV